MNSYFQCQTDRQLALLKINRDRHSVFLNYKLQYQQITCSSFLSQFDILSKFDIVSKFDILSKAHAF